MKRPYTVRFTAHQRAHGSFTVQAKDSLEARRLAQAEFRKEGGSLPNCRLPDGFGGLHPTGEWSSPTVDQVEAEKAWTDADEALLRQFSLGLHAGPDGTWQVQHQRRDPFYAFELLARGAQWSAGEFHYAVACQKALKLINTPVNP